MIFSEEDIIGILKKSLPNANYKDLESVAKSIVNTSDQWQEADLDEHIHDEVKKQLLHDICKQTSNNKKPPQDMRLFFKE